MMECDDDCLVTYFTKKPTYTIGYQPRKYLYSYKFNGRRFL